MRLAWYAGVSTALAATVVVSAFHQRANFYSAMVYLAQSNICLLVLVNFVYLIYGVFVYGLQRVLYGPLRPVEVEQLAEKAWFAITETCLAMTIFREEIGAWFLVMFTALVTGKVWGWIGDGRVEVFEQNPPTNTSFFRSRLAFSLVLSLCYDMWLLQYTVQTVIRQARPTMMVMFLFEFAVLATCSWRTGFRYGLSLLEAHITNKQTNERLQERRRQLGEQRAAMIRQREEAAAEGTVTENDEALPNPDDVDEMDIEVPGWEEKGQWVLGLDLFTDFIKLAIYSAFFFILLSFYGLPIHIMRDLFMTARSFVKRLTALLRYRRAIQDMNRYADATPEDLAREDTCIVCREDMRPWDPVNNPGAVERSRPKKLPCGHILHYGCLKSWLERQQVCPTCRRPVVAEAAAAAAPAGVQQPPANGAAVPPQAGQPAPAPARGLGGIRMFNLGPLRLGFAQGRDMQEIAQRFAAAVPAPANQPEAPTPSTRSSTQPSSTNNAAAIRTHLDEASQLIQQEMQALQNRMQAVQNSGLEIQALQLLNAELNRVRSMHQQQTHEQAPPHAATHQGATSTHLPGHQAAPPTQQTHFPAGPSLFGQMPQMSSFPGIPPRVSTPSVTRHVANGQTVIPAGSPDLPEGVVLPPGWSLLPLQRFDGHHSIQPHVSAATPQAHAAGGDVPNPVQPTPLRPEQGVSPRMPYDIGVSSRMAPSPSADTTSISRSPHEPPANVASAEESATTPPVVAPTPMPNWGGSAQMFAPGNSASNRPPSNMTGSAPAEKLAVRPATAEDGDSDAASTSKGKGKAVTVEEADEEEDE